MARMGADTPKVTQLLEAVREGDQDALSKLLEHVQPQVYRYGMRMCRHPEDAEDILQETLISLARRLPEFRGDASLSTYVYAVARSHCAKKRRRTGQWVPAAPTSTGARWTMPPARTW